jgi:hypothetical protein
LLSTKLPTTKLPTTKSLGTKLPSSKLFGAGEWGTRLWVSWALGNLGFTKKLALGDAGASLFSNRGVNRLWSSASLASR